MCGIVGFAGQLAVGTSDRVLKTVRHAADALAHRGPDGDGFWIGDGPAVAFGHRRLAIIDLSSAANQPMVSTDQRSVLTFNGEIYNYKELRSELIQAGHHFRTESDTEVVLTGCRAWGVAATAQRAKGMFAFAYLDRDTSEMWLVRDRFGEKPLYWSLTDGTISFASELKALRALPGAHHEIDRASVAQYMQYQAISAPQTIYRGVSQIRAGSILKVVVSENIASTDLSESIYWDAVVEAERARSTPFLGSRTDATDQLEDLLGLSVKSSMVSDVPLGAFLSGGIDSSTIVALMCKYSSGPVKTFTIGFEEDHMSEAEYASKVAAHLGVDHSAFTVTAADALAVIPRLADMYDEPFGDSSQIPTHLVSGLARQHVTVSLSGDGGDELFAGYNRYFLAGEVADKVFRVPGPIRRAAGRMALSVSPAGWDRVGSSLGRGPLRKFATGGLGDRVHKAASVVGARSRSDLYQGFISHWPSDVTRDAPRTPAAELTPGFTFTEQMMLRDTVAYMPDDILVKVDRAAMATSLETRVPMLDPDVYRFAWSLPLSYKAEAGTGKLVLRDLLSRHVPTSLFDRPKMGFGIPLDSWLRGPLREWGDALLNPATIRDQGFFDVADIRRHWTEHQSGSKNWQAKLWDVLMFQAWMERWG